VVILRKGDFYAKKPKKGQIRRGNLPQKQTLPPGILQIPSKIKTSRIFLFFSKTLVRRVPNV
jgi:hypothetical protein